jgi:hypothetical protein
MLPVYLCCEITLLTQLIPRQFLLKEYPAYLAHKN